MAVHGIGQSHLSQPEPANTQLTSRSQNAGTNGGAANTSAKLSGPNESHGRTAAAAAENNAGHEQRQRQGNGENPESKGTLVSVYA
jgi:hypothetical protein